MIFSQKFFSGDYLFFYASDENDVVVIIKLTLESADKMEDEVPDDEVVGTMGYDMLETME